MKTLKIGKREYTVLNSWEMAKIKIALESAKLSADYIQDQIRDLDYSGVPDEVKERLERTVCAEAENLQGRCDWLLKDLQES